ncbi:MAG: BrnT family toxin [Polyangiaceae bacterium]
MATVRQGEFEWDVDKARLNLRKHGVTFEEATSAFFDPLVLVQPDAVHSDRFIVLGQSDRARTLFVVYAERDGDRVRLISAREATAHERKAYQSE